MNQLAQRRYMPPMAGNRHAVGHALPVQGRGHGLTLIEVLIGLALATILMVQAVPDLRGWLSGYRLSAQASALSQALAYARSEAVTRSQRVTVCSSANPLATAPRCNADASWAAGWLVFVDNVQVAGNVAGSIDGDDTVLRIGEPLFAAQVSASSNLAAWLAFTPDGMALASGGSGMGSFLICQSAKGQRVTLNNLGRAASEATRC